MKQNLSKKIGIKKFIIAKINTASLSKIKGGTSIPPSNESSFNGDLHTVCNAEQ
ncbi:hypothetical protein [uncultured Aquimarina sp.]|uniref:hypothetical protein n=1 Tax=uncultured Aquimarina sp. TaxID=575652 RepID=UPI00261D7BB5|nr:hypothetical protein [uncultured Aquimarina sp.]